MAIINWKTSIEIDAEKAIVEQKRVIDEAQKQLDDTDWIENQLLRCSLLYGADSVEYTTLLAKRMDLLTQRNAWVEIIRASGGI